MDTTVIVISCIINLATDLDKEITVQKKAISKRNKTKLKQMYSMFEWQITFFVAKILKSFKNYFVMSIIVDVNHYYCDQLFRQKQKRNEIFILKRKLDL